MLKSIELNGFKSFGRKSELAFTSPIAAIVGPNGSGKSNIAESFRFVLGEQSMRSLRSRKGEDLIWGGSNALPRSNRASVKVTFDNASRTLAVDFPEVVIERAVFRDGVNEYSINGSAVRLRDVAQLLATANVGASGYHIISQGEADRVLSASPRERREMVEEALGLKAYQHKKAESEKKLEETAENLKEAASVRREIAPHLSYLRKQVERIEKARELADDLATRLSEYLAREHAYITEGRAHLMSARGELVGRLTAVQQAVAAARVLLSSREAHSDDAQDPTFLEAQRALHDAQAAREDASRALGRAEGELAALRASPARAEAPEEAVPASVARAFVTDLLEAVSHALAADDLGAMKDALRRIEERVHAFKAGTLSADAGPALREQDDALRAVADRVTSLSQGFEAARHDEQACERHLAELRESAAAGREAEHQAERELIARTAEEREIASRLAQLERELEENAQLTERFNEEVREGIVLIGGGSLSFESSAIPDGALSEPRSAQEDRRRAIERLKIKIEEYRGSDKDEVMKEYTETRERDEFLAREIGDLERSAASLRTIIEELEQDIDARFASGLSLIRTEFHAFFTQLFGGGNASLELERAREAEDGEEGSAQPAGLAVSVQLPRKQMRGLEVLSGGERALTSIALIFAMSQVNPPPFLILDETDAALDEANSRRYAEIVKTLAKKSQLILITHNRATMAAAGELYGVTMGQDGVSKLLSVKLEEAQAVAK